MYVPLRLKKYKNITKTQIKILLVKKLKVKKLINLVIFILMPTVTKENESESKYKVPRI